MKCKLCNKIFTQKGFSLHLSNTHNNITHKEYYDKYLLKENETTKCKMCGKNKKFYSLTKGYRDFCQKCNRPKTQKEHIEIYGNLENYNNANEKRKYNNSKDGLIKNHGKKKAEKILESFKVTKKYMIKKYGENIGEKKWNKLCKEKGKTVRIEYWIKQGYSKNEAKEKLKERQSTFSLEKCIQKHGEIDGKEIWKQRQEKWQNTLKSKTPEEIEKINRMKTPKNLDMMFW